MSAIIIRGGRPLSGSLTVQGAKNSVLPILAATLLSGEVCRIRHCPRLRDVETAMEILRHLGCRADWQGRDLLVDAADLTRWDVPDHLMSRMRSSVVFLGAILARCGQAEMTYPGGCELGARPIDLHLASLLRSEGATVFVENIFDSRYRHVPEMVRMGADIRLEGRVAVVCGVDRLHGAAVRAKELRGGASLVLAGLQAEGETAVTGVEHIQRGYEDLTGELAQLGADIRQEER